VHFCGTRHKPDFGEKSEAGKSEANRVGKAAPAGRPKSDCAHSKPEKYGASMAARYRCVAPI